MKLKNFDFSKKVALHPKQVEKVFNNLRPFPTTIEIDITNHCNHRCSFCVWGVHISTDKSTLKKDVIEKCILNMRHMGSKAITFTSVNFFAKANPIARLPALNLSPYSSGSGS